MSEDEDVLAMKRWRDKVIHILPLTFGRARIYIGPEGQEWYEDGW